jgi:uncharacterized protein (TIGR03067 family)
MTGVTSILKGRYRVAALLIAVVAIAVIALWRSPAPDSGLITLDQSRSCVLNEQEGLQGHWVGVGTDQLDLFFYGNMWTHDDQFEIQVVAGPFKLDPTKSPKWIDFVWSNDGWVEKGIYELEGSVLKVYSDPVWAKTGHRPTAMPAVDTFKDGKPVFPEIDGFRGYYREKTENPKR